MVRLPFSISDVVLWNAGQLGEPFLGQPFPVAVGPQGYLRYPQKHPQKRSGGGDLQVRLLP